MLGGGGGRGCRSRGGRSGHRGGGGGRCLTPLGEERLPAPVDRRGVGPETVEHLLDEPVVGSEISRAGSGVWFGRGGHGRLLPSRFGHFVGQRLNECSLRGGPDDPSTAVCPTSGIPDGPGIPLPIVAESDQYAMWCAMWRAAAGWGGHGSSAGRSRRGRTTARGVPYGGKRGPDQATFPVPATSPTVSSAAASVSPGVAVSSDQART
ncbi:hypothetical protein SDC9_117632 [bioreactor metagenome]|uniref:Uncharacterized protein n=1 Tax=bioreactor metagenome TaxID=1076179 RepID=A0A645BYR9_9ZZZZ